MDKNDIQLIHNTAFKFFVAIAGGGQSFLSDYCSISGASKNLIGAIVPYNELLFNNFIGCNLEKHVTSIAARKLAMASYKECLKANISNKDAVGIGATSSVATNNERKERKHKIYVAIHCYRFTSVVELILNQGRTRQQEDALISEIIFLQLSNTILDKKFSVNNLVNDGEVSSYRREEDRNIGYLINKETDLISSSNLAIKEKLLVYSGSFNPLHKGHLYIKEFAQKTLSEEVFFEITINNADKGNLDYIDLEDRIAGLGTSEFILTNIPTFKQKVEVLKKYCPTSEIVFVIGADTWNRIWDIKYGFEQTYLELFFESNQISFLVLDRIDYVSQKVYGQKLLVKYENFEPKNISSTEIRKVQES